MTALNCDQHADLVRARLQAAGGVRRAALRAAPTAKGGHARETLARHAHRGRLAVDRAEADVPTRLEAARPATQASRDYDALGRAADAGRPKPVHRLPADATADDTRAPSRLVARLAAEGPGRPPTGRRLENPRKPRVTKSWPCVRKSAHKDFSFWAEIVILLSISKVFEVENAVPLTKNRGFCL